MKQETNVTSILFWIGAAVVTAIAAAELFGIPMWGSAVPTAQKQPTAATSEAPATARQNPMLGGPNPNAPMTRAQGAAILRELRAIRLLLQRGAAPPARARRTFGPHNVKMQVKSDWHKLGRPNAPVTMVEFTDLQCPFCRRFQTTTFAEVKKKFIDTGKVRFVSLNMPLPMHHYAMGAAEALLCAGGQGKFWQFRDAVLDDQAPPTPDVLLNHAKNLGLNVQEFQSCLNNSKYKQVIRADQNEARTIGIRGTPAFVIGRQKGEWVDGVALTGARPFQYFQQQIEKMLNETGPVSAKTPLPRGSSADAKLCEIGSVHPR